MRTVRNNPNFRLREVNLDNDTSVLFWRIKWTSPNKYRVVHKLKSYDFQFVPTMGELRRFIAELKAGIPSSFCVDLRSEGPNRVYRDYDDIEHSYMT